ncbi:MAG: hypothetical protein JNK60_19315, partial [Acidobacteria bacterium]|nr:hypothetical protein [Acidobacteriota bacterium]
MRALVYLILAATWLGDTGPVQAAKPSKRLSGGELVLRLLEVKTRGAAYYELSRRANPEEAGDESTFRAGHREPEVVLCPQRGGLPPVYLVLSRFLDENPGTPPLLPRLLEGVLRRRSELLIDAFSATGERIAPFGGNNVLDDGIVEDLDGDGLIERACRTNYGIDGVARVQVLEVSTIGTVAEPRFAVLYNWGEREEWDYRFVRRGGRVEIEVGPVTAEGVRPEVTFRWDEKARRFAGPAAGDHFRVLHAGEVWRELERLRAEGLEFPPDPEFVPPVDPFERVSPEVARRVAAAKPYVAGSLRSLTNAEILRYMGKGSSVSQLEMEAFQLNRLPARFWDLPPREAALALVETNRTAHHRSGYELSMRAPGRTLATGTVRGTARSAPCYERSSVHTFLKVAPGGSSFVRVQTSTAGTVFRDLVDDRETYEVRELPIPYREARHVLNVVVALKDVRSSEVEGKRPDEAFLASTADGSAEVEARGPKGVILTKVSGTPFGSVAERWTGGYSDAIALSLATYLLEEALPERLGRAWVALAPEAGQHVFDHDLPDPPLSKAERDKLTERGARLLARFSPDASDLSFAMVSATVRMAGNQALGELAGRIEEIQASRFDDSEPAQQLKSECAVALRKIRSAGRTEVLTAWASSEEPGSMWAVRELLRSDPASAIPALELWLERTTGDAARQVFAALARVAPDRARDLARGLSAERRRDLAVAAAGLETPDAMDVAELIRVATAATTAWEQRLAAIRLLVPPEEPLRHPGPEVDRTLFQLLEPQPGDTLRFAVALASRALALRRSA